MRNGTAGTSAFEAGVCMDLGAFDPTRDDCGVAEWMERARHVPAWVTLMEDRQPVFFHGYRGWEPDAPVPLNRHGPHAHAWRQRDVKRLVDALHAHDVAVFYGYWVHECEWVDERHPELVIRDATGTQWQDRVEMNADFNPLRRMRADAEQGIAEGERYYEWAGRRYAQLAADFGFDGLFLGDGAMGFRRHGHDWKDLRHFDYDDGWLEEFTADATFRGHAGCALARAGASTAEKAEDVRAHHWDAWVEWNVSRWTEYYAETARAVHAAGGRLAAYNVMNYDPALARLHGVDYRRIAEAGLDILVFQAYDYAWGPLGPFGDLHIARKDLDTNLAALLRVRAHVGYDTRMRIVVSVETEDEVETWNAPVPHTLGELYAYGTAVSYDGDAWRRALDGVFVVWGNSVDGAEWTLLDGAISHLSLPPAPPHAATVWEEDEPARLARLGAPTATEPDLLYAHLAIARTVGEGPATTAIVKDRWASVAPLSTPGRRSSLRPVRVALEPPASATKPPAPRAPAREPGPRSR